MEQVTSALAAIASMQELVESHSFTSGEDHGPYFSFTFGTLHALRLWEVIQTQLYENATFGHHLRCSSIATCSGEDGWNDYLLLFHFDPEEKLDSTSTVRST
jgi:hypothetical protein